MLEEAWDNLLFYFDSGGFVMIPLAIACVMIWFGIGYRWSVLRRRNTVGVRRLVEKHRSGDRKSTGGIIEQAVVKGLEIVRSGPYNLRHCLDDAFADDEQTLKRYSRTVNALVAVAPILGLLGTVDGMIETFDALGDMTLFSQSGGIAGGISQALFTTQLGLAVAIPGLIINGMLERRARERRMELTQLKDLLCAEVEQAA